MKKHKIILGVIGADCHSVGNKILDIFFTDAKFKVINLGVLVSQNEFIDSAIEHNASAILVSSIYGHGEIDCCGFRNLCTKRGLNDIILYIGGNLIIAKSTKKEVEKKFIEMGYDRVFHTDCELEIVAKLLRNDIEKENKIVS